MSKLEIQPPDYYQLEQELEDMFLHGDFTSVSNFAGIKYKRLYAMIKVDDPQENCVSEAFKVWYGVARNDQEKGRKFFRLFDRQALAWKLTTDSPLSIMESVIDKLRQIKPEDVKRMGDEQQMKILAYASIIEDVLEGMKKPACNAGTSIPIGG